MCWGNSATTIFPNVVIESGCKGNMCLCSSFTKETSYAWQSPDWCGVEKTLTLNSSGFRHLPPGNEISKRICIRFRMGHIDKSSLASSPRHRRNNASCESWTLKNTSQHQKRMRYDTLKCQALPSRIWSSRVARIKRRRSLKPRTSVAPLLHHQNWSASKGIFEPALHSAG